MEKDLLRYQLFTTRTEKERFRKAVTFAWREEEKEALNVAQDNVFSLLAQSIGETSWWAGYGEELESLKSVVDTFDYGCGVGVAVDVTANKHETIRQYCHQFVETTRTVLVDNIVIRKELDDKTKELSDVKNKFLYRIFNKIGLM